MHGLIRERRTLKSALACTWSQWREARTGVMWSYFMFFVKILAAAL